jgi:hypothetical protein
MADELLLVNPPFIPDEMELASVHFNVLFTHLFPVLSGSESMPAFEINTCKQLTVTGLLDGTFPVITSADDTPLPVVTSKTVGYVHTLVINTVTPHNSNTACSRALGNEQMIYHAWTKLQALHNHLLLPKMFIARTMRAMLFGLNLPQKPTVVTNMLSITTVRYISVKCVYTLDFMLFP